jgi:hypothetical protein
MNETTGRKGKGYGLFGMAAAIYTAGVVAFSIWSYFQQRTNLLAEVDRSLIHATHATEQILGGIFIACAVETGATYELGYAANQKNLNRFANDCHFDVLGAVGRKGAKQWELICGGKRNGALPPDTPSLHELLLTTLFPMVDILADSGNGTIRMQTVEFDEYGELRAAIRYHPISADTGYAIVVARNTHDVNQLIHALAMRAVGMGILLYAMAFPLIVLYHFARARSSQETANLNTLLLQDFSKLKEREAELEDAIHDLERFNAVAIGRESRIIELKAEVNTLLEQMKQPKRYSIDHVE